MFQRKYDEYNLDIDETIVTELLEHDKLFTYNFKHSKHSNTKNY